MKKNNYTLFIAFWLASTVAAYAQYQLNALAIDIMGIFSIGESHFASLFTAPMVPAIFLSIPAGKLSDKYGAPKIVSVGLFLTLLGCVGRIFCDSYMPFWICMMLTGLGAVAVNVTRTQIISDTICEEQAGMFMGLFITGSMLSQFFATATTASMFHSLTMVFIASSIYALAVWIFWLLQANIKKTKSFDISTKAKSSIQDSSSGTSVFKNKGLWLTSAALFLTVGATITLNTFLPAALMNLYDMSSSRAGMIASTISLGNLIGGIVGPIIATRMKSYKKFFIIFGVLGTIGCTFGWICPNGVLLGAIFFLVGILIGGAMPIYYMAPLLLKNLDKDNNALASGFLTTLQLLGAVVVPTYIIAPIAGSNYPLLFILCGACILTVLIITVGLANEFDS